MSTIDNLPDEIFQDYAKRSKKLPEKQKIIEESGISKSARIDVVSPSYIPESTSLFGLNIKILWGDFLPPPGYNVQSGGLFNESLFPFLFSEAVKDKIKSRIDAKLKLDEEEFERSEKNPEAVKSMREEHKECEIFNNLMEKIHNLDAIIVNVKKKREQFQKG
jgi:predicted small metal-binding protein